MRFYIDSKELNAGILSVIKALPVRSSMAVLEGIHVEALRDGVRLKCSDLMMQKECILPATVEEEGKAIMERAGLPVYDDLRTAVADGVRFAAEGN